PEQDAMIAPASAAARRRQRRKTLRRLPLRLVFLLLLVVAIAVGALTGRRHTQPKRLSSSGKLVAAHAAVRVPAGPIPGLLLIADRGNDRILLVDNRKRILWRYPPPAGPA